MSGAAMLKHMVPLFSVLAVVLPTTFQVIWHGLRKKQKMQGSRGRFILHSYHNRCFAMFVWPQRVMWYGYWSQLKLTIKIILKLQVLLTEMARESLWHN
ncbi:uncharacterized protein EDB93DRAFT_197026 [Suillus bovinus]|uniref:uncharacterized protein n=1 Tax=Suillus bovinus TaxID=48563 RepID=UPI001B87CD4D|nr:uncharacterized protein EDB93DRAFT_197026 [Suillus bovinus]KAG2127716.1 hypothetical protein EDB93DRAFT_197026 [Suillus bovinus]